MRQHRTEPGAIAAAPPARKEPGRRSPVPDGAHPERRAARGMPNVALLFLLSLLPQIGFAIGPLALKPYRIVLLVLFLPLLVRLVSGGAGRMLAIDWLMIGASSGRRWP